jgi:hypothetical protein
LWSNHWNGDIYPLADRYVLADGFCSLTYFVDAVYTANARWNEGSELFNALEGFGGDVVQAIQALKESQVEASNSLKDQLSKLELSLSLCQKYCQATDQLFPLTRAQRQVRDVLQLLYPGCTDFTRKQTSDSNTRITISSVTSVETFQLGHQTVPRLFTGLWQLSSPAWGSSTAEKQELSLTKLVKNGLTAADMADHYVRVHHSPADAKH